MTINNLQDLARELNALYPTRYNHYDEKQQGTFIVYFDVGEENFHADDLVYTEGLLIDIDLYSDHKNLEAERRIKNMLRSNKIPYDKGDTNYIQAEKLYLTTFTIKLITRYDENNY